MFSRCPHCDVQQAVTIQLLRDSRGLLTCESCGQTFDVLATLSERADESVNVSENENFIFAASDKPKSSWVLRMGNLVMTLALLAQIGYFEADNLTRQPQLYALLTKFCQALGCQVPLYKNPAEWSVSHSDWQAHPDNRYELSAALTNHADVAQAFPVLKLTLNDYTGQTLAERAFSPKNYTNEDVLAANHSAQIRLPLVVSAPEVGGFKLTLM